MNTATRNLREGMTLPPVILNDGETYAGAIIKPDGTGHHIILLPGDNDAATWEEQMEWAKSIGGDLPDRVEQAMFYKNLPEQFQPSRYWSVEQRESGSAWFQFFLIGYQYWFYTDLKLRARAVRRVSIGEMV